MGLFDYVKDHNLRCPYCGGDYMTIELQTKDTPCMLETYWVHDRGGCICKDLPEMCPHTSIPDKRYLEAHGTCRSPRCDFIGLMERLVDVGYVGYRGRVFLVRYKVDKKGRAYGQAQVVERSSPDRDVRELIAKTWAIIRKAPAYQRNRFAMEMDMAQDFGVALLTYHPFENGRKKRTKKKVK